MDVRISRPVVLELHRAERAAGGLADGGKAALLLAHRVFQSPGKPVPEDWAGAVCNSLSEFRRHRPSKLNLGEGFEDVRLADFSR